MGRDQEGRDEDARGQAALVTMSTSAQTTAMSAANIDTTRHTCRRAVEVSVDREEATGAAMISHFRLSGAATTAAISTPVFVTPVINVSQVACGVAIREPRVARVTLAVDGVTAPEGKHR